MELETVLVLADALQAWRQDFTREDYRVLRLDRWKRDAARRVLRERSLSVHWLLDRVQPLPEGLNAWFVDLWLLFPPVARGDSPDLQHALQVVVCGAELTEPPLPTTAVEASSVLDLGEDRATGSTWLAVPGVVPNSEDLRLQFVVNDVRPAYRGRPSNAPVPWSGRTQVQVSPKGDEAHLVAQLALMALRQREGGQDLYEWLVNYGGRRAPTTVQEHMRAAVDHAVTHFVLPATTLRRYLFRVARGLATEGVSPRQVTEEAQRLGVSKRTLYHWRAQGADDLAGRAEVLAERRMKAELVRRLAEQEQITHQAARMRINRRLRSGATLVEVGRALLRTDGRGEQ